MRMSNTTYLVLLAVCFALIGCKTTADSTGQPSRSVETPQTATSSSVARSKENTRQQALLNNASVFETVLPSLKAKTKVPLRLPVYLATENESNQLYAIIESASPSEYEIQLAFTQNCSGGNVCHYGMVSGRAVGPKGSRPKGKEVSLTNGLSGYFIDATCGAVCSDSTLTWDEGGFRYTVGLKAEKVETLKKAAESAMPK